MTVIRMFEVAVPNLGHVKLLVDDQKGKRLERLCDEAALESHLWQEFEGQHASPPEERKQAFGAIMRRLRLTYDQLFE